MIELARVPRDVVVAIQVDAHIHGQAVFEALRHPAVLALECDLAITSLVCFNKSHSIWVDYRDEENLSCLKQFQRLSVTKVDTVEQLQEDRKGHLDGDKFSRMMCTIEED